LEQRSLKLKINIGFLVDIELALKLNNISNQESSKLEIETPKILYIIEKIADIVKKIYNDHNSSVTLQKFLYLTEQAKMRD
jgi:hypothetical protein